MNELFHAADDAGINILKKALLKEEIIKFLNDGHLLIVLVNSVILPSQSKSQSHKAEDGQEEEEEEKPQTAQSWNPVASLFTQVGCIASSLFTAAVSATGTYVGHFILLIDYIPERDSFTFRDPGATERKRFSLELSEISAEDFDKARSFQGTDDDVVAIKVF